MSVEGLGVAEILLGLAGVIAGSCLQGSLGFGLGLLAAPLLALIDTRFVPGPLIGMGVPLTVMIAWRERRSLDIRGIRWAILGRLPGTVAGSAAVALLAQRWLAVMFGVVILLAVLLSVVGFSVEPTSRTLFSAGVASGFMGTSTSVGGPPIALVYQRRSGPELRASIGLYMVVGALFSLFMLVLVGEFGTTELALSALLVPGVLIGFLLSRWTTRFLDRGFTRQAVLAFAAASAVSILIRELV